jgi:GTPase SAR1 family protein
MSFKKSSLLLVIFVIYSTLLLSTFLFTAQVTNGVWFAAILAMASSILINVMFLIRSNFRVKKFLRVAVIGFPRSGKTTLITSLFGEGFKRNLPINLSPRGLSTIERVNKSLEMLEKGRAIGPTQDQDMFAFRADVISGSFLFRSVSRVEIGDFPGSYTQEISQEKNEKKMNWLPNSEFFRWITDSDVLLFVIDIGKFLSGSEERSVYVAEITAAFRATWQQILDNNRYKEKRLRKQPLAIVFNKFDLIYRLPQEKDFGVNEEKTALSKTDIQTITKIIDRIGFGEDVPPIIELDHISLESDKFSVQQHFSELINYFQSEVPNVCIIFSSSFAKKNGAMLGMGEIFSCMLGSTSKRYGKIRDGR